MIPRTVAAALLVAVTTLTTACGDTQSGNPTAQPSSSAGQATSNTSTAKPTTTTAGPDGSLATVDPCALLTAAEAAALAMPGQGRRQDIAGTLSCIWPAPGISLTVTLDPTRGLADTNTGSATKVENVAVGGHSGRRVEESSGPGYCGFDLAITEKSSASVSAIILSKTQEACGLARRAVDIVEPKLP